MDERHIDSMLRFYKKHNPRKEAEDDDVEKFYMYKINTLKGYFIRFNFFSGYTEYIDVDAIKLATLSLDYFLFGEEIIGKRLKNLADTLESNRRKERLNNFDKFLMILGLKKLKNKKSIFDNYDYGSFIKGVYERM
jgi:hypothetical protein